MSFMGRLEKRWDRRQTANGLAPLPIELVVEGDITIAATRDEVWKFWRAPESALVVSEDVSQVFHVPGTPFGAAGEQVVQVSERAGLLEACIMEVAVLEPAHRVVEVCRTHPWWFWVEATLTTHSGGTSLAVRQGLKTVSPEGESWFDDPESFGTELRGKLQECLLRTKRVIEAGMLFPSQADSNDP